jgi:hypothetical protein
VVSGHYVYNRLTAHLEMEKAEKFAKITAYTWVAAAKFNKDSTQYRSFRDSILSAEDLSMDEVDDYFSHYQKHPERYVHFANFLDVFVDSLVKLEDSILLVKPPVDSTLGVR